MKGKFFEGLKEYLLNNHKHKLKTLIPYYETIKQNEDKLGELLNDVLNNHWDIQLETDEDDHYSEGVLRVCLYSDDPNKDYGWQYSLGYEYEIHLLYDERYWGYCDCEPQDEGYDHKYKCCGNGCDWIAPQISVVKAHKILYKSFDGIEKDMWRLLDEWEGDKVDHKEEQKKAELHNIEKEINALMKRKENLLNT